MDVMQSKIQEIMKEAELDKFAAELIAKIHEKVADHADAIAIERCKSVGVDDMRSHEAAKMFHAAEQILTAAVLRHAKNINDHA